MTNAPAFAPYAGCAERNCSAADTTRDGGGSYRYMILKEQCLGLMSRGGPSSLTSTCRSAARVASRGEETHE